VDGDTLRLRDGAYVRLLQIDAPEPFERECYGHGATRALVVILPPGTAVRLDADPQLDRADRYGRLLRYAFRGSLNVNLALVERGAAAPYFYRRERGRYAGALLAAARRAKAARLGLWGACPRTRLDPDRQVDTRP